MGKGEIARYEQFLLFPQCFQKAFLPGASKGVIVWEWLKGDYSKSKYGVTLVIPNSYAGLSQKLYCLIYRHFMGIFATDANYKVAESLDPYHTAHTNILVPVQALRPIPKGSLWWGKYENITRHRFYF